jgi:hypothetical protein
VAANPITKVERLSIANDPVVRSVRGVVELGPRVAAAEPPWPELPSDQEGVWERFMRFPGPWEAHIVAGRLNVEGVPIIVLSALAFDLSNAAEILVPRHLMHRARWVLAWPAVPEEELQFLATGEIGPLNGGGANGPL